MVWYFPLKKCKGIPVGMHPGSFANKRSYYYHTGVDLYCNDGDEVFAVEDGVVVNIEYFTGSKLGHSWWEETESILIKGESGVVVYGELIPAKHVNIKSFIRKGEYIGNVKRVLPINKYRPDIKWHSTSMLHLELYKHSIIESVSWNHNHPKDDNLLDPTKELLKSFKYKQIIHFWNRLRRICDW